MIWLNERNIAILQERYPCTVDSCDKGWVPCEEIFRGVRRKPCLKCKGSGIELRSAGIITHHNRNVGNLRYRYSYFLYKKRFEKEGLE